MARMLANKCTLAARVDASHESSTGEIGRSLREQVEKTLEKMLEPPPVKSVKALPKPVDPPRKRRGGKRVRKMKERFAVTELRKQANRTTFGDVSICASDEFSMYLFITFIIVYVLQLLMCFFISSLDWRRRLPRGSWL